MTEQDQTSLRSLMAASMTVQTSVYAATRQTSTIGIFFHYQQNLAVLSNLTVALTALSLMRICPVKILFWVAPVCTSNLCVRKPVGATIVEATIIGQACGLRFSFT